MYEPQNAVAVSAVSRMFKRYRHPRYRVLEALGLPLPKNAYDEFWALRDISFEVKRGDSLAIIGQNGAGKSTLLSIVCGRLQPSSGSVAVRGEIQALMDLGTGFHPEFTGRQNIYSALAYQGITGAEADERFDEIVDFSELDEFIHQPIKTYSTGMYARLAFSTATAIVPDVLIIDEILSAGDAYFAAKCADRMRRLTKEIGATVLFVSHDLSSVQRLCERAIWLERGRIKMVGATLEISKAYYASVAEREEARLRAQTSRAVSRMRRRDGDAGAATEDTLLHFRLVSASGRALQDRHAVRRFALVTTDSHLLEVCLGEPMDNDPTQASYILTDPELMCWSAPKMLSGCAARYFQNTGGAYQHAPAYFRLSPDRLASAFAIEVEHAAAVTDTVAVEIYEGSGYRRLGLLTPSKGLHGWLVDRFSLASEPVTVCNHADPSRASKGRTNAPPCAELSRVSPPASSAEPSSEPAPRQNGETQLGAPSREGRFNDRRETEAARFFNISSCNPKNLMSQHVFALRETVGFCIIVEISVSLAICWLAGIVFDERGNRVLLGVHKFDAGLPMGKHEILFQLDHPNLRQGDYVVSFELLPEFDYGWVGEARLPYLCHWDRCVYFKVDEGHRGAIELGLVAVPVSVTRRPLVEAPVSLAEADAVPVAS
jgi:lipopolysaccharide transport system ATP-binding protein